MTRTTYGEKLGSQLRTRRRQLQLRQTEVADLAGTTQRSVSQAEAGRASGLDLYASIGEVLGLKIIAVPHDQAAPGDGGDVT